MQRCLILIDGSNFYFKLKDLELHNLLNFNFSKFTEFLIQSEELVGIKYYVGKVRQDGTKHADKLLANQQKLIETLKRHKVRYEFGYILKSGGVYHEKGVDVHIAVDMLVAAYEDLCDRIILISSDTDLAPAIKKVQEKGKIVEYLGFSHQPSVAMVRFCRESRMLTKKDLLSFIELDKDLKRAQKRRSKKY